MISTMQYLNSIQEISRRNEAAQHLPLEGLPNVTKLFAQEVATTYQCSLDMVITAMLTTAGIAAGKKVKTDDGVYTNRLNLWYASIARSGKNKSRPVKLIVQPLREINRQYYAKYQEQLEEWKSTPNNPAEKPHFSQVIASNSTSEARYDILARTDNGLLIYSDEIRSFLENLNRYSKGADLTELLSLFDNDDVEINRKSNDPVIIEEPVMAIMGGLQPSVLKDTFGSPTLMGSGFNQRWIFTYEDSRSLPRFNPNKKSVQYIDYWKETINRIFNSRERTLYIRGEALMIYGDYYNDLQERAEEMDDYMASVCCKLQIIVQRIAGIIHLIKGDENDLISAETMKYAVSLMGYYERTANLVYREIQGESETIPKKTIIRQLFKQFNVDCQSGLARELGVSQQYINKCLRK